MRYFAVLPEIIDAGGRQLSRQLRAVRMGLSGNAAVVLGQCMVLGEPQRGCRRSSMQVGTLLGRSGEITSTRRSLCRFHRSRMSR
jgi:hypothetical protein